MSILLTLACGFAIGVALGLLGGGGSLLAIPVLVYALGESASQAVPVSLLAVGLAATAAAIRHIRAGNCACRSVLAFGVTGVGGSAIGTMVAKLIADTWLLTGFAALMLIASVAMFVRAGRDVHDGPREQSLGRLLQTALVGAVVGFFTGLFGVGGGFVIVPALVLLLGFEMPVAVGTSLVIIVIDSAAAFIAHIGSVTIDLSPALTFAGAALVGALAGSRWTERFDPQKLTRGFAYLIVGVSGFVLFQVYVLHSTTA